jgi:phytoene synthase
MKDNKRIKLGYSLAKTITKKFAKTYYFASRFLPKDKRYAAYSIYAICRISDESVDDNKGIANTEKLMQIKKDIDLVYAGAALDDNLLSVFKAAINRYQIPKDYFDKIIEGMGMDLNKQHYANFDELYEYCYRVAGVVGLIMLKIFGYNDPQAKQHAVSLGIAMQLTNILRDIKEDLRRGRIYLPEDEMRKSGVTQSCIWEEKINEPFKDFLRFQIKRAREYYAHSSLGIKLINDAKSRFVVLAIKEIYSKILDAIEDNGYDVFSRRVQVSNIKKISIALEILLKGRYR